MNLNNFVNLEPLSISIEPSSVRLYCNSFFIEIGKERKKEKSRIKEEKQNTHTHLIVMSSKLSIFSTNYQTPQTLQEVKNDHKKFL
jgi:hypothetical protein